MVDRQEELRQIKQINIVSFLSNLGFEPRTIQLTRTWFKSPLREERTPSFCVYTLKNDWYDFGAAKGGSIIDLVMALFGLPYVEAVQMLRRSLTSPCSPSVRRNSAP